MRKSCLLFIRRTQKPVMIKIPGLLETLSNVYYSSVCIFMSTDKKKKEKNRICNLLSI